MKERSVKTLADVMKLQFATCSPETVLAEVCQKMNAHHIGVCFVVADSGEFKGILTERDVIKIGASMDLGAVTAIRVCKPNIFRAPVNASLDEGLDLMEEKKIRRLAVEEGGRIVGVVEIEDLARTRYREELIAHKQVEAVRTMVATYSHELANPLAIVSGFLSRIEKRDQSTEIQKVRDGVDRIETILSKIRNLTYLEAVPYASSAEMFKLPEDSD
jgi:CBS domain-containing protein